MEVLQVRYTQIPTIFADAFEEEDLPVLPGLFTVDVPSPTRPKELFEFYEWKGLTDEEVYESSTKHTDFVSKVQLPTFSSEVELTEEHKKPIQQPTALLQDVLMQNLDKIKIEKLQESIDHPKSGYQLPELKSFAKQLEIPTTDLRKAGLAQAILSKIKLKET